MAQHIGGRSPKGMQLRAIARSSFKQHRDETDEARIAQLKADAIRALSNYLVMKSLDKR